MVEFAIVAPLLFVLIFGLIIGGLGVARYQRVASLAREASRWASVRGAEYAARTHSTAATASDVYTQAIVPKAGGLDLSRLTYTVTWNTDNRQYHTAVVNGNPVRIANTVSVALSYQWIPEISYVPPRTMRSTSVSVMSF
jgi:Flp pilus assembly protein TadG